jgi:UDP-glucose 6-dehydrogenase
LGYDSDLGHEVINVDIDQGIVDTINDGYRTNP